MGFWPVFFSLFFCQMFNQWITIRSPSEKWKSEKKWVISPWNDWNRLKFNSEHLFYAFFRPRKKMIECFYFGIHKLLRDRRHNQNSIIHPDIQSSCWNINMSNKRRNERPSEQREIMRAAAFCAWYLRAIALKIIFV